MTGPAVDANLVRLGRALHDLAAAIDTTEHAASQLDIDANYRYRADVERTMESFRLLVIDLQRDLEFRR